MAQLKAMSELELRNLHGFCLGHSDFGEIAWMDPVDVHGVDLDKLAMFEHGAVVVDLDSLTTHAKAPNGANSGLSGPARVSLFACWPKDPQTGARRPTESVDLLDAHEARLVRITDKLQATFLGYDRATGRWSFLVTSFQSN